MSHKAHLATQMWLDSQAAKMLSEKRAIEAELRKFAGLSFNKVLSLTSSDVGYSGYIETDI
jgi:hypothetical protein